MKRALPTCFRKLDKGLLNYAVELIAESRDLYREFPVVSSTESTTSTTTTTTTNNTTKSDDDVSSSSSLNNNPVLRIPQEIPLRPMTTNNNTSSTTISGSSPLLDSPSLSSSSGGGSDGNNNECGGKDVLDFLKFDVLESCSQMNHPGFIAHMDPPTPSIAIASGMMQIATNQNLLHPDVAPKARLIERRIVDDWIAPQFGMNGGHIVPGGTVANITAIWAAREVIAASSSAAEAKASENYNNNNSCNSNKNNNKITTIISSDKCHLSIKKAANMLGLKYIECKTNDKHEMILEHLYRIPELNQSVLVLTAGTVATGAFDSIYDCTRMFRSGGNNNGPRWIHVDAAWAGPLKLSTKYGESLFRGIEDVDSIGFSAHKWLYQPKGSAFCLFKDAAKAHSAISYGGGYLSAPNVGILGSAPASAIPLCATIMHYGLDGIINLIENDMEKADQLIDLIVDHNNKINNSINNNDNRSSSTSNNNNNNNNDDDDDDDATIIKFELFRSSNVCGVVVWRPVLVEIKKKQQQQQQQMILKFGNEEIMHVRNSSKNCWVSLCEIGGDNNGGEFWFRSVFANPNANPKLLFREILNSCNKYVLSKKNYKKMKVKYNNN